MWREAGLGACRELMEGERVEWEKKEQWDRL